MGKSSFRLTLLLLLLMAGSAFAYPPLPLPRDEEETLLIRRILNFWRDQEYAYVQAHIKTYLKRCPKSPFSDHFWAFLGDIALSNQTYDEALEFYEKIQGEELKQCVQLQKWKTLYHLGYYSQLYQEITPHRHTLAPEGLFYYAEAAFREAQSVCRHPEGAEVAKALYEQALPLYASLAENYPFSNHSKLAMAEIHRYLGHPKEAAALYQDFVGQETDRETLFHIAQALSECDKPKAAQLFKRLAQENEPKAAEAAYQWLLLLAAQEEWETIGQERKFFTSRLKKEHLPTCYFYLGMQNFDAESYQQACTDLQKCVRKNLPPQNEKKALLALMAGARKLHKWELAESLYEPLCSDFPEVRPEASCLLASAYKKGGKFDRALKLYAQVAEDFPETSFAEKAHIEKMRLLIRKNCFATAHETLLSFLEAYPQSERKGELLRLAIDLSLLQLAEEKVFGQLAADIERGFETKLFDKEEMDEKTLLLIKAYLKLGRGQEALDLLQTMENPDPLLIAHCYIQQRKNPDSIIAYGEAALAAYPHEKDLHIHLFNAYVERSKERPDIDSSQKAAAHLEAVLEVLPISLENRLWLGHYYMQHSPLKAIPILESILGSEGNLKRFEEEAFQLASLYMEEGEWKKAEDLLLNLSILKQKTELAAQLKLGELYVQKGDLTSAKTLYQKLEECGNSRISCAARLYLARVDFASHPEESLEKLQDLTLRKCLAHEPIHLEAALDFAELKASTYPEEDKEKQFLELLLQTKEDFTQQNDLLSKDYHANRRRYPDKELLYQAYMRYLDARIYLMEARLAQDPVDEKTKLNAARALFSTLRHGKYAVSQYIKERSSVEFYEN